MNKYINTIAAISALLISSCAKYRPHQFKTFAGATQEQNGIYVSSARLSDQDCYHYFSRHAVAKGYQPIQLCIRNESSQAYILKAENIDLQIENRNAVIKHLQLNTGKRMAGWAIGGLFVGALFIPAIVEGAKSSNANKRLAVDFEQRVMSNDSYFFIEPCSSINQVVFLRNEHYRPTFELKLIDAVTKETVTFTVRPS